MKRNLRFYFALFVARALRTCLRLIGKKGTNMPGDWAVILCPDFLGRMPRPKTVIGITGTNGKTTVANMVEDVLGGLGYDFICNRLGSNVDSGLASAMIANSSFFGKPKKDLAVFELDERMSPRILPYLKPDILLVTNLFRDSYKRNAHVEFISDILERYIPKSTKLLLNADDLICASLRRENERVYFGIDRLPEDGESCQNIVRDVRVCPNCGAPLKWDFVRYHHIGRPRCPNCGLTSPAAQYRVKSIDQEAGEAVVSFPGGELSVRLPNTSIINVYNAISAMALLGEFGISKEKIAECFGRLKLSESRYSEEVVNGRKVILHLAKGQNPIACSRAFENIRDYPGKKAVILFLDDHFDAMRSVENTAWLFDTDFEFLNSPDVTFITAAGARHWDVYLRLLLAEIPPERMNHTEDVDAAAGMADLSRADSVFILYDVYTIDLANRVKEQVKARLEGGEFSEN